MEVEECSQRRIGEIKSCAIQEVDTRSWVTCRELMKMGGFSSMSCVEDTRKEEHSFCCSCFFFTVGGCRCKRRLGRAKQDDGV